MTPNQTDTGAVQGVWFPRSDIIGKCASDDCSGTPIWRLEAGHVGSNYCSDCKAKIERASQAPGVCDQTSGERAVADAMNALLLIEHGCDEAWARHFIDNWNAKCEELARARQLLTLVLHTEAAPPDGQVIANQVNSLRSEPEPNLLGRETVREAVEQIAVVCTDNMDANCNHRMALDFVRQVANAALAALQPSKE